MPFHIRGRAPLLSHSSRVRSSAQDRQVREPKIDLSRFAQFVQARLHELGELVELRVDFIVAEEDPKRRLLQSEHPAFLGALFGIRQQELGILSALPEVLDKGSKKFLRRLGCQNAGKGGLEGSWQSDWSVMQRMAMDKGEYIRIGQLSPDSPEEELLRDYT